MNTLPDHAGAEAVGITALRSFSACSAFLIFVVVTVARSKYETWNTGQKTPDNVKMLYTQCAELFGFFFLNLVVADCLQSLGFTLNLHHKAAGSTNGVDGRPTDACQAQGLLIQAGDLASAAFTVAIACHTLVILVFRFQPSTQKLVLAASGVWAAVILLTISGPLFIQKDGPAFWNRSGLWCFVSPSYELSRFTLHYLFIFIAIISSFVIYLSLFVLLRSAAFRNQASQIDSHRLQGLSYKLMMYPFAYSLIVLPLAIFRVAGMTGRQFSTSVQAGVGCVFALAGLVNVLLYATTRHLVKGQFKRSPSSERSLYTSEQDRERGVRDKAVLEWEAELQKIKEATSQAQSRPCTPMSHISVTEELEEASSSPFVVVTPPASPHRAALFRQELTYTTLAESIESHHSDAPMPLIRKSGDQQRQQ